MADTRRIKPPTRIDLSYQKIEIVFLSKKENPDTLGGYEPDDHKIEIRSRLKWEEEANTLLHELLHAIYHCYRIKDKSDEEVTVTTMSNGLMELMTRNPKLQEYFTRVWDANR